MKRYSSSRPSSPPPRNSDNLIPNISDTWVQLSALRTINSFLSSHNSPISLSLEPLPSATDLTHTLKFLLSKLDYVVKPEANLEDDLFSVLEFLNCPLPYQINKSALRAPGDPHSFPFILAVIHWLVGVAHYFTHCKSIIRSKRDNVMTYFLYTYSAYMMGDEEAVELYDKEVVEKLEKKRNLLVENLSSMDEEFKQLEVELATLKSTPSDLDKLEKERSLLVEILNSMNEVKQLEVELTTLKSTPSDLDKFQGFVASLPDANSLTVSDLAAKVVEIRRIKEELKKRVQAQGINMRDAEIELMSVEREISEAESSTSSWEENCWEIGQSRKFQSVPNLSNHDHVLNLQIPNDPSKDSESKARKGIMKYNHSGTAAHVHNASSSVLSTVAKGTPELSAQLEGVVIEDITPPQQTTRLPVDHDQNARHRRSKGKKKVHSQFDEKAQGDEIVLSLPAPVPKPVLVLALPKPKIVVARQPRVPVPIPKC